MQSKKKTGLKIIIVGCSKVGNTLAAQLSKEGNDLTVIDTNSNRVQETANLYDILGIVGNGASYSVLMEADIKNTDLIIAVTESDELNLLCCTIAKRVGNCAAIARVRTPDYSKEAEYLREKLGLIMIINPDLEAAREIARVISLPNALEVDAFAHGQAQLVKFKIPEGNMLDNITIADISKDLTDDIVICAVERDDNVHIPTGEFRLLAGDEVSYVSKRTSVRKFLQKIGLKSSHIKTAMIVGGGNTSYYLAKILINSGITVKIIEENKERCEELSVLLPKAVIINGDGTNEELLREEGIDEADAFLPLTNIDEENIILTLFANQVSKSKVITKIDKINFKNVINQLDLGSVIYPQYITSEAIIAYVRAKKATLGSNIETLYQMFDRRAEAIEFSIEKPSKVTNVPLMNLSLKKNLLITFIKRKDTFIFPKGQDSIQVGDSVMIVTTVSALSQIDDILE